MSGNMILLFIFFQPLENVKTIPSQHCSVHIAAPFVPPLGLTCFRYSVIPPRSHLSCPQNVSLSLSPTCFSSWFSAPSLSTPQQNYHYCSPRSPCTSPCLCLGTPAIWKGPSQRHFPCPQPFHENLLFLPQPPAATWASFGPWEKHCFKSSFPDGLVLGTLETWRLAPEHQRGTK